MTKQEFQQWAVAVVQHVEGQKEEAEEFAQQVEEHDKEAAALIRRNTESVQALADHLRTKLG